MESLNCPTCGTEMTARPLGPTRIPSCPDGHGVFLARADLGVLVEAEIDWHSGAVHQTAAMPRITADMAPPPASPRHARAWVETLFD